MPEGPATRLRASSAALGSRVMKTAVALLASLLFSTGLIAQTASTPAVIDPAPMPALKPAVTSDAAKDTAPKQKIILRSTPTTTTLASNAAAPAANKTAAAADATKKAPPAKQPEAVVKGIAIARPNGGFLGLELIDSTYKLTFYNAQKLPVAPDVARALLRWNPKGKVTPERYMLNLGEDGKSLSSPRPVRPPYAFKLYITLIKEGTAENAEVEPETHTIDFHP